MFSSTIFFLLVSTAAVHRCLQLQSILLSSLPSIHPLVAMGAVGGSGFGIGGGDGGGGGFSGCASAGGLHGWF